MPRRSTILANPHRATLDALILERRRSIRDIAAEFGLTYDPLQRYALKLRGRTVYSEPSLAKPEPVRDALGPVETLEQAFGFEAMPHQVEYLNETRPLLASKGRQTGMSTAAAALAVYLARSVPKSTSAIISPSQRQSIHLTSRARLGLWELGEKLRLDSTSQLMLQNGSQILSLPGSARSVRGFSCLLVVLDEASWISPETIAASRPLVSATGGRLILQSTPGAPFGDFYNLIMEPPPGWATMHISSEDVPTITKEFLEGERATLDPSVYAAEYQGIWPSTEQLGAWFTEAAFDSNTDDRFRALNVPKTGDQS